jgi:hypothetical protein
MLNSPQQSANNYPYGLAFNRTMWVNGNCFCAFPANLSYAYANGHAPGMVMGVMSGGQLQAMADEPPKVLPPHGDRRPDQLLKPGEPLDDSNPDGSTTYSLPDGRWVKFNLDGSAIYHDENGKDNLFKADELLPRPPSLLLERPNPDGYVGPITQEHIDAWNQRFIEELRIGWMGPNGAGWDLLMSGSMAGGPRFKPFENPIEPLLRPVELRGSLNPNTAKWARRGSTWHADHPGRLPEQLRERYPETNLEFRKPGIRGQDVTVVGGKHPSEYPGSTWPEGVDYGDFKPDTPDGRKTFKQDQKKKWKEPTHCIPYDPNTGKLK